MRGILETVADYPYEFILFAAVSIVWLALGAAIVCTLINNLSH